MCTLALQHFSGLMLQKAHMLLAIGSPLTSCRNLALWVQNPESQGSLVYPYPSVSDLAGGNSDHGPSKTQTKTQTTPDTVFTSERRNSDHGLSCWRGKTQTRLWVWGVFGVGVDEGALRKSLKNASKKVLDLPCSRWKPTRTTQNTKDFTPLRVPENP